MKSDQAADAFARGVDAYRSGELDVARAAFEEELSRRPRSTATLCNLAGVLGSQGDYPAAVGTYDRALDIDPNLEEAIAGLAWALPMAGRDDRMPQMVDRWLSVAPDDPVARHLAASLGRRPAPARCEPQYIESFFDGFAESYDKTLDELTYRAPRQLANMLRDIVGTRTAALDIIDAGCGTGLCGPLVRPFARTLVGIDLSARMLQYAHDRKAYDELARDDLVEGLLARPGSADFVISADVLVYFGELLAPFGAAAAALRPGGRLLASIERTGSTHNFILSASGRYEHSEAYVRQTLEAATMVPERACEVRLRYDRGEPVAGLVFAGLKVS